MPLPFRLLSLEIIQSKASTVIAILVALFLIIFPARVIWTSMRTVKRQGLIDLTARITPQKYPCLNGET
jgi:hypothetical protein